MTILRTGIDLIEIERLQHTLERYGERFLNRVFTPQEQADAAGSPASLAVRFAAKEAVSKALGTGIGQVCWYEIEVLRGPKGDPCLLLHGAARQLASDMGLQQWAVSLSHTHEHAVAIVVASG